MSETVRQAANSDVRPATAELEQVFARHQSELLGTLFYLVGNWEDARDALQETFVKCWRHQDKICQLDNLKAWIFRIALNTARDLRQTAWRRRHKPLTDAEPMIQGHEQEPLKQVERSEQLARIQQALQQLRPQEQEVFLLRQNGELTYAEIARATGIPVGTVKTRMRLALSKLRIALAAG